MTFGKPLHIYCSCLPEDRALRVSLLALQGMIFENSTLGQNDGLDRTDFSQYRWVPLKPYSS